MLRKLIWIVALSTLALAQAPKPQPAATPATQKPAPAASPAPRPAAPAAAKPEAKTVVPPNTPIITIDGLCPSSNAAGKPADCKTVVTKAEFDKILKAISPYEDVSAPQQRQVAQTYSEVLVASTAARSRGLEKDPNLAELIRITDMQVTARYLIQQLQHEAEQVPDAEIEKYYNDNKDKYEAAKLLRLYIPKPIGDKVKPEDQKAVKDLADKLRTRAAAGEDLTKLEQEAFDAAKNASTITDEQKKQITPLPVDIGEVRRGRLPEAHENAIFSLKPGEVTPVFDEQSGYFIYKLVGKEQLPVAQVKDEIKNTLSHLRFNDKIKSLTEMKPVFNEEYFGTNKKEGEEQPPKAPPAAPQPPKK